MWWQGEVALEPFTCLIKLQLSFFKYHTSIETATYGRLMKQIGMICTEVLKRRYQQVYQYIQRQCTDERFTFGSKYITMKTAVEMIKEFRYELSTFWIEIDSSAGVFCDMKSVTKDTTLQLQSLPFQRKIMLLHIIYVRRLL